MNLYCQIEGLNKDGLTFESGLCCKPDDPIIRELFEEYLEVFKIHPAEAKFHLMACTDHNHKD